MKNKYQTVIYSAAIGFWLVACFWDLKGLNGAGWLLFGVAAFYPFKEE